MGDQFAFCNELVVCNVFGNNGVHWSFADRVKWLFRDVGIAVERRIASGPSERFDPECQGALTPINPPDARLALPFQFRESCRRISGIEECHVKCQRLARWARNVPRQLRKCIQEWQERRTREGSVAAINAEGEAPCG